MRRGSVLFLPCFVAEGGKGRHLAKALGEGAWRYWGDMAGGPWTSACECRSGVWPRYRDLTADYVKCSLRIPLSAFQRKPSYPKMSDLLVSRMTRFEQLSFLAQLPSAAHLVWYFC